MLEQDVARWCRREGTRSPAVVVNSAAAMVPSAPEPTTSEVRAWARANGITVADRGRLHPDIWQVWRNAQQL